VEAKIKVGTSKYRAAHVALTSLSPVLGKVGWEVVIRVLKEKNICPLNVAAQGQTEGW
jgi:hypothetical protein